MREPVNDLSPAARELVARIERAPAHDLGALVRTANRQPALAELRRFIATVRERFGVPGSLELDRDRLAQAITNATPERLEAFTAGFSRAAQSIVSRSIPSSRPTGCKWATTSNTAVIRGRPSNYSNLRLIRD